MKNLKQYAALIFATITSIFSAIFLLLPLPFADSLKAGIIIVFILLPQILVFVFQKKETAPLEENENFQSKAQEDFDIQNTQEKINELEAELSSHLKMEEASYKEVHKIALRSHIFSPVFKELCNSISHNLSTTTEPLSQELFKIKKDMTAFLNHVKQYEDEVKNHHMLNQVSSECSILQTDMQELNVNIREIFNEVETKVTKLQVVNDKIGEIAKSITDVSEKIRILSFNASIEAARAGNAGKGFRVIANEIKDLSTMTDDFLAEIWETLKNTQGVFDTIRSAIKGKADGMFDVLTERQAGLKNFIKVLQEYFKDFADLFDSVNEIIDTLSHSMNKIAPVIQLHEITSQEVGNMKMLIQDIGENIEEVYSGLPSAKAITSNNEILNEQAIILAKEIRKRLTTESELKALKKALSIIAPEAKVELGMTTNAIELF